MDTTQTTNSAPLTRREARALERQQVLAEAAALAATTDLTTGSQASAHDFKVDTGRIARNEAPTLVSVLPTDLLETVAAADVAVDASETEVPAAFRGLSVRAARPASLRRARGRLVGGAAAMVAVSATAVTAFAVTGGEAPANHQASLLTATTLDTPPSTPPVTPTPAPSEDASVAPEPEVAVDEGGTTVQPFATETLLAAAEPAATPEPSPEASAEATSDSSWTESSAGDSSQPESTGSSDDYSSAPSASASSGSILAIAESYMGTPYVFGGTSPSGFDCAGFVSYVLNQSGYSVGTSISQLAALGTVTSNPKPGDLVVYGNYHIGFYGGPNSLLHAPYEGDVVRYGNMNWASHYFVSLD
ncbi:peptidoglycan endopeptidase [Gulosibacter macacae]|uniref:Peptidoglycan endopeptidase n=1 Tax=Gulosibacter macacae TaxID=2488791 RepID=A0A3P3VXP9_9MICO|nr:C40 family peptidase [Gulosibacter macacae]RRJ87470.1 peptidoglycan endopeptidase [Gulosibacter macacae]